MTSCQGGLVLLFALSAFRRGICLELEAAVSFEDFKVTFGRQYLAGSGEHKRREAIFKRRSTEVAEHNARALSWKLGVNDFTDWTDDELKTIRGHKPVFRRAPVSAPVSMPAVSSFVELISNSSAIGVNEGGTMGCSDVSLDCSSSAEDSCCSGLICGAEALCVETAKELPAEKDWSNLPTAYDVMNQGSCGSCWAVAATTAIQLYAALVTKGRFNQILSPQNLVSCTENEHACGGDGGCEGATAELAFGWASKPHARVDTLNNQKYTAGLGISDSCAVKGASFLQVKTAPSVHIKGFKKLKVNNADAMMKALVSAGPVVGSIVGSSLHDYSSGVLGQCKDYIIDHAVTMMGFGMDQKLGKSFWNIRNSWGADWGERGFFRLQRAEPGQAEPCGTDTDPSKGVACKNDKGEYPKKQRVCGVCGILSDTSYPVGVEVPDELLAKL